MPDFAAIKSIKNFKSLVKYLRTHLDWPIDEEDASDLTFDYEPDELGLDEDVAVKIREIKQVRPLVDGQPWGIFWIDFEPKRLPVVAMRRILNALVRKKRSRRPAQQAVWDLKDLMFISATGEGNQRGINFAHFREDVDGLPQLRTFSWDADERHFYFLEKLNLEALHWPSDPTKVEAWRQNWASAFSTGHGEVIATAKDLASRMAGLAVATRELVNEVMRYEKKSGPLHKLYDSFKRILISDLSEDDFADMYAQTVTYGLFSAAATPHTGKLALENVVSLVPSTNPFLRDLLAECLKVGAGGRNQIDLDELGVGELVEALQSANMEAVLHDFGRQSREHKEDPVIHFYESFLREYDPEKRLKRGVVYTPDPVVSFIVRSVDYLLRTEFDCPDGLADTGTMPWKGKKVPKVQVLDPATGTGTFLKYTIEQIYYTFTNRAMKRGLSTTQIRKEWNEYVPKHLLPRLYGFELMMAPYSVAHMKLGLALRETEYNFGSNERLRVYLTNTLQPAHEIPRIDSPTLAHEAEEANKVKTDVPVTVIMGNPPYSNFGMMNKGEWILDLLKDYKKGLNEKKLNLDDDFIKFIRFAQWRIDQTGQGILAFITNNTYIDGLTHRRMRESLMETFDEIYILDLHGSIMRKETAPDGSKDANVFDIQQGVSIGIFVKRKQKKDSTCLHADLLGTRELKYSFLLEKNVSEVEWQMLNPNAPNFFFVPKDFSLSKEYDEGYGLKIIFPIWQNGLKTDRDELFFDFDRETLESRMRTFFSKAGMEPIFREEFRVEDSSSYDLLSRRSRTKFDTHNIHGCLYRPFDVRHLYYAPILTSRPAWEVMQHMLGGDNLGLVFMRQVAVQDTYSHILATRHLVDNRAFYSNKGIMSLAPLYVVESSGDMKQSNMFVPVSFDGATRRANLSSAFIEDFSSRLGLKFIPDGTGDLQKTFGPEDVFHYIYAVFHSPTYRERYAEFLKIDFPRVPLTRNAELFRKLAAKGAELVALHLMESPALTQPITEFIGKGDSVVAAGYPKCEKKTVWINGEQGFEGVPQNVWDFQIGGYQVCHKWLKDRRGRKLSAEDKTHYAQIVVALKETIRLMKEIDAAIPGWPIK